MSASTDNTKRALMSPPAVSCTGKVQLASRALAMQIINRSTADARPSRTPYHCGYCGQWHIGTDKGKVGKRISKNFKERKQHDE